MATKIRKVLADIAPDVKCANCNHLASAHGNTADGANNGVCSMKGCDCKSTSQAIDSGGPAPDAAPAPPPPGKAAAGTRRKFVPAPPIAPVAPAGSTAPADDAEVEAPDPDLSALVKTVATAISAALTSLAGVDVTTVDGPTQTFIALVHAADNSCDLLDGVITPDADAGDQIVLAETVDACIVAARNVGDGLTEPPSEITAAVASIHEADVASGDVLESLGAPDPDVESGQDTDGNTPPAEPQLSAGKRFAGSRFADAPIIAPMPGNGPSEVPAPTPSADGDTGVSDPNDLAGAVDAAMDAAFALLVGIDQSTLPPEVAQALSLMRAADSTLDDLMDSLGVADPDEAITADAGKGVDATGDSVTPAADSDAGVSEPGGPAAEERFKMPIMVIEGVDTGDGRFITPNCLSWRDLPFPVMAITKTTMGHDEAELVGRIDTIERIDISAETDIKTGEPFGEGVTALRGTGVFASIDEATRISSLIRDQFLSGVSVDIGDVKSTIEFLDDNGVPIPDDSLEDEEIFFIDGEIRETLTEGRVMGVTICPFPAFEGAYVELDDGTTTPQTREAVPEDAPEASVASIFNLDIGEYGVRPCLPCKDGAPLVASAGPMAPPVEWFDAPDVDGPTPLTISDTGRIFGHLATWATCHTGVAGRCVTAPHSKTNYGYFRTGAVQCADGTLISTGPITLGGGHAGISASAADALRHYDDTNTGVADVATGEDRYGIWIAGAMRPDVTPEQVRRLRASALSGDWRNVGGHLELIAALAVNAPGLPIVRSQVEKGIPVSLVAAGARQVMLAAAERMSTDREMLNAMRAQWPMMQALIAERDQRAVTLRTSVKAASLRRSVHAKSARKAKQGR